MEDVAVKSNLERLHQIPRQVFWSLSSIIPRGQEHLKPFNVLLHTWEHPAVPAAHSSMSVTHESAITSAKKKSTFTSMSQLLFLSNYLVYVWRYKAAVTAVSLARLYLQAWVMLLYLSNSSISKIMSHVPAVKQHHLHLKEWADCYIYQVRECLKAWDLSLHVSCKLCYCAYQYT